jgi:hypothetical protein
MTVRVSRQHCAPVEQPDSAPRDNEDMDPLVRALARMVRERRAQELAPVDRVGRRSGK